MIDALGRGWPFDDRWMSWCKSWADIGSSFYGDITTDLNADREVTQEHVDEVGTISIRLKEHSND